MMCAKAIVETSLAPEEYSNGEAPSVIKGTYALLMHSCQNIFCDTKRWVQSHWVLAPVHVAAVRRISPVFAFV